MKKAHLLYLFILFAAFISCEDDYVAPNSFSDVSWYSVVHDKFDTYPIIGQGDYYSISDISQGAIEHKWELLDSAIYFLGGRIVRNDSTLQEKIIGGGNIGDFSTDKTVHLYFPKGGIQSVRLYNTFENEVSFVAKDRTIKSVFDATKGVHVFDYTFTVDVYHDVVAAYKVYRENGDSIDFTAADTIKIDLNPGDKLSFAQKVDSIYHITDVQWTFPKGVPTTSTSDSVTVTFYSPGVVKGIKLRANRSGNNIPSSNDLVEIPLQITVADGPFMPVNLTKVSATSVKIQLSGVAQSTPAAADFTVTAKNADLGQDFNIGVASVALSEDKTNAILTLAGPIYSNDEVEVTYSGTNVKSADGRTLQGGTVTLAPITDLSVVDTDFFGFESATSLWLNSGAGGLYDFVANPAGEAGNSVKIQVRSGATVFLDSPNIVSLQAGTKYKITYRLYLDSRLYLNNGFNVRLVPEGKAFNDANALIGNWMTYNNTSHFTEGAWVTHSFEKVPAVTGNYWMHIRVGAGNNATEYGTFYIDDINVEVVDSRPSI